MQQFQQNTCAGPFTGRTRIAGSSSSNSSPQQLQAQPSGSGMVQRIVNPHQLPGPETGRAVAPTEPNILQPRYNFHESGIPALPRSGKWP